MFWACLNCSVELMIMKLSELTSGYRPTYPAPYRWEDTVQYMLADPFEKEIVDYLVDTLRRKGTFREPIFLGVADLDDDEDTPAVVNGTHRVCAHIIFGSLNVEVKFDEPYTDEELADGRLPKFVEESVVEEDSSYASTSIVFASPITDDDEWDTLFTLIRSFPLSDEVWVTSDVFSSSGANPDGTATFNAGWDLKQPTPEIVRMLETKVWERLKRYPQAEVLSMESVIECYDEDGNVVSSVVV